MTDIGTPGTRPSSILPSSISAPGTRSEPGPAVDDHDRLQEDLLNALARTIHHFHGGTRRIFAGVADPRQAAKIDYPLIGLLTAGLLMFVFRLGARRQIALQRRTPRGARKMKTLCGTDAMPHGDTLNEAFKRVDEGQMQEVVCSMVETLIRNKVLDRYRLLGNFTVAIDGTGLWKFGDRHCEHCLTATHDGRTRYYHSTLEAKLVTPDGFAISLMTEFIENGREGQSKQDCELRAFYRLADRLKQRLPRLGLLLTLDGLYAVGPVFDLCYRFGWKDLAVLKDESLKSVNREFASLAPLQPENRLTIHGDKLIREFTWVNHIDYTDTMNRSHRVHVLQCVESAPSSTGKANIHRWISNVRLGEARVQVVADEGGRIRWKIENEGFNVQKNGGYGLEHA